MELRCFDEIRQSQGLNPLVDPSTRSQYAIGKSLLDFIMLLQRLLSCVSLLCLAYFFLLPSIALISLARIRQGQADILPSPLSPERSRPCSILLFVIASPCGSAAERRGTSAPGPRWIGRGLRGSGRELAVSHNTRALAPVGVQAGTSAGIFGERARERRPCRVDDRPDAS